ncbi:MAG: hypothetical protein UDQ15_09895 [Ruminococcus sp.]|nr:hypothetical protein [Ruminococcus sp.]
MQCFYENELFKNKSRRQIKSFSVQQFFKNAAEVWASSPHLRSKSRLYHKIKQKSKKQSKESQLPSKSDGCNERYGFRGNCDSHGKLGMCPSLAEPISSGFSKSHVSHETIRNPLQLFPRNSCKITAYCFRETRRGGLVRPPRKAVAFLTTPSVCQEHGTGISLPAGSDQGYSP